jgi:site-specific DNA recombinase
MNDLPKRKRAAIYVRVSTTDQAERNGEPEGYSIPAQRGYCQGKAEMLGADVVAEYVDAGESAKSADRPQLQKMLERIKTVGDIDYVIVHKINRLARSMRDYLIITGTLQEHGVQFVSVTENIDDTPYGKFMQVILAGMAELESNNLATEVVKGSVQKAKAGGTPTMAPIGYLNVKKIVDGQIIRTIEVDPERAPLVQWVFETYATGQYGITRLHEVATAKGLLQRPTKNRPARPMHLSRFAHMLHNRYYIGYVTYKGVKYTGKHPPLVSRELFEQVQRVSRLHDKAGERRRVHHHYLKGSLACARCGSRMSVARANGHGGTYDYFFCLNRMGRGGCYSRYVPVDKVEDWICDYYAVVQLEPERLDGIRTELLKELEEERRRAAREVKRQSARLKKLVNERQKLLDAYYVGAVPLDVFSGEQARIQRGIDHANEVMMVRDYNVKQVEQTITEALELAADWGRAYKEASPQVRRQINQAFYRCFLIDFSGVAGAVITDDLAGILTEDLIKRFERQGEPLPEPAGEPVKALPAPLYARRPSPLFSAVGSSKSSLVDLRGIEPLTSCLPSKRSTN